MLVKREKRAQTKQYARKKRDLPQMKNFLTDNAISTVAA